MPLGSVACPVPFPRVDLGYARVSTAKQPLTFPMPSTSVDGMGWIRDGTYGHKGWVANVLADGRVSSSTTGHGVIVGELTAEDVANDREVRRYPDTGYVEVIIPWDQVVTWRVTCECGWTGSERPATTKTGYSTRDCPDELTDRVFAPEWQTHVAPFAALTDLDGLIGELRSVETRIAKTVWLARTGGASWAQVGRSTGLTKQGAQQRWGTTFTPTDVAEVNAAIANDPGRRRPNTVQIMFHTAQDLEDTKP